MVDKFLFELCRGDGPGETWAILADGRQWMLAKMEGKKWRPRCFVACYKRVLLRVIDEEGVAPTEEAQRCLGALPDHFNEWIKAKHATRN